MEQLVAAHTNYAHRQRAFNSSDPPFVGILGAGCSGTCMAMQNLANTWRYPTLSFACAAPTLTAKNYYPYFLRTTLPDSNVVGAWLALARTWGWRSLTTVNEDDRLFEATMTRFAEMVHREPGKRILRATETLAASGADPARTARVVRSLVAARVRVVFFACYEETARVLFRALYAAGMYGPGYVFITLGWLSDGWWEGDAEVTAVAQYHFTVEKTTCGVIPNTVMCGLPEPL
jgi:ABC-type branched-subunit amino acid transport system substrate-binding protein